MNLKAGCLTARDILIHPISRKGNTRKIAAFFPQLPQEIFPASIRQSDITNQEIKLDMGDCLQSRLHTTRSRYAITPGLKKSAHGAHAVQVVVDQKNVLRPPGKVLNGVR